MALPPLHCTEHGAFSVSLPGQGSPPFDGGGLSHSLIFTLRPSPHVTSQGDQGDHPPQPPLTAVNIT